MKTIATLGPQGTFSDTAARKYIDTQAGRFEVEYFSSIKSTLKSIGETCDYGVIPVENFSEGFVSLVIDHLVDTDLAIIGEIMLPIQFSFVSPAENIGEMNRLFVQFAAKGQCSEFLDSVGDVEIVTTESNIESLERVLAGEGVNGAVVPAASFPPGEFRLVIDNINDYKNNQTRFLVLSAGDSMPANDDHTDYKTSLIVFGDRDHPGLLESILSPFTKRGINLTSIVSRPTRRLFGMYHFFIDFEGHARDENVTAALGEISGENKIKVLGSYPKAKIG